MTNTSLLDPFLSQPLGPDLPERLREFAAPVHGEPAFDPDEMKYRADRIPLRPDVSFEHPLLERAVRIGLAHIDATFQGDHPKYGVDGYADEQHDGFPPTLIATLDALTRWDMTARAEQLFSYWLNHFVREDGTIDYYGPALSEYGQLLTAARTFLSRGGSAAWLRAHAAPLGRMAGYLLAIVTQAGPETLPSGSPEADERTQYAPYFHNSAWIVRGLSDWADIQEAILAQPEEAEHIRQEVAQLQSTLLWEIRASWPTDPNDWWLSPVPEAWRKMQTDPHWARPVEAITANRLGSYTNYRYWPELLSSGVLPSPWMLRLVRARERGGGQFCGATRFEEHLDDWPLAEYLEGLWKLGMYEQHRLSVWGHLLVHQDATHMTAYEQVSLPPGEVVAAYCLPAQLVVVRAAGRLSRI